MPVPKISVVMPVKNALPYLDAAVQSVLDQSHSDFEFIIRDDGSSDNSRDRLRFWAAQDKRIRLFEGDRSLGPAGSSNWVVSQARTPIVARMDADDISTPDRLRRQFEILQQNPDTVLVGSVWEGIDGSGNMVREPDLRALRSNHFAAPFAHGSIMFRREAFARAGGYRPECDFWEDLDLYLRLASMGSILVSLKPLYQYRFSETSTRLTSTRPHVERAVDLMFACRAMHESGKDYTPLLAGGFSSATLKRRPETLLSLSFTTLWSGHRPGLLRHLITRSDLGFDMASLRALVWAVWAAASPMSLRYVMRILLNQRSSKVRRTLNGASVCEWRVRGVPVETAEESVSRSALCV